jgi:hypothetical protein
MNAADNRREAEAAVWEFLETRGISRKAIFEAIPCVGRIFEDEWKRERKI